MLACGAVLLAGCFCPAGEAMCGGRCVRPASDLDHCGGCGRACATACVDGACLPERPSVSDAECDDHSACNGLESCSGFLTADLRSCRGGEMVRCDDGVMCTRDRCLEPAGTCVSQADDARCPGGTCDGSGMSGCTFPCDRSPCGLTPPQCGCADVEACYLTSSGPACHVAGLVAEGGSCDNANDCAPGLSCMNVSLDATRRDGRCRRLCADGSDCASRLCPGGAFPGTSEIVGACAAGCTPHDSAGCPRGDACVVYHDPDVPITWTECASNPGTAGQGEPCAGYASCAPDEVPPMPWTV